MPAPRYDPSLGSWIITGSLREGRYWHTATLLNDGSVLIAGGFNQRILASAEIYDPATGTWTETGALEGARARHTAQLLEERSSAGCGWGRKPADLLQC